ncbi:fungal-specific transcription factor domain-containing protein [Xylariaceae sp. FL1272]|nr:fungal-specific transcription factor domain-containing protein [Xylariaceae sp. FL1272]
MVFIQAGAQCVQATRAPNRPRQSHQHELKRHLDRCEQLLQEAVGSRRGVPERPSSSSSSVSPVAQPSTLVARHRSSVKDVEDVLSRWTPFRRPDGKLVEHADGTVSFMEDSYLQSVHEEVRAMREILDNDSTILGVTSVATSHSYSPVATNTLPSRAKELDTDMGLLGNEEMAASYPTAHLWPASAQVFRLWHIYLERVNPFSKVIHVPSLQPFVVEACVAMENIPQNIRGLLFAIFLMAVIAMREEETQEYLGMPRDQAFARFSSGTRRTLRNQDFFCKNDLVILQTLAVYTMSLYDQPRSQRSAAWILSGVALRIGQRMGLHQDGERLGLSPFETEMQRRLWWQLVLQDAHFALGAGLGHSLLPRDSHTLGPLNLNDADIYPAATEPFVDRDGPTEMVLCRVMYKTACFMTRTPGLEMGMTIDSTATKGSEAMSHSFDMNSCDQITSANDKRHKPSADQQHISYYSALLDELERDMRHIRDKQCNPASGPAHRMAAVLIDCLLKHLTYTFRPAQRPVGDTSATSPDPPCFLSGCSGPFNADAGDCSPEGIFRTAVGDVEIQNMITAISADTGFAWFSRLNFRVNFESTLYVARQLRKRTKPTPLVDAAWKQIEDMYGNQEGLYDFSSNAHRALAKSVLEAWRCREVGGEDTVADPPYIERLAQDLYAIGDVDFLGQGMTTTDPISSSSDLMTTEPMAIPEAAAHQHQYDVLFSATESTSGTMDMDGMDGFANGCGMPNQQMGQFGPSIMGFGMFPHTEWS